MRQHFPNDFQVDACANFTDDLRSFFWSIKWIESFLKIFWGQRFTYIQYFHVNVFAAHIIMHESDEKVVNIPSYRSICAVVKEVRDTLTQQCFFLLFLCLFFLINCTSSCVCFIAMCVDSMQEELLMLSSNFYLVYCVFLAFVLSVVKSSAARRLIINLFRRKSFI